MTENVQYFTELVSSQLSINYLHLLENRLALNLKKI